MWRAFVEAHRPQQPTVKQWLAHRMLFGWMIGRGKPEATGLCETAAAMRSRSMRVDGSESDRSRKP